MILVDSGEKFSELLATHASLAVAALRDLARLLARCCFFLCFWAVLRADLILSSDASVGFVGIYLMTIKI